MARSDESAVCAQITAVAVSLSQTSGPNTCLVESSVCMLQKGSLVEKKFL